MGNFVDNNQDRCPIALVVDVSSSRRDDIGMLNAAIEQFRDTVLADPVVTLRVEVALVAFNHQTEIRPEFSSIDEFDPGPLEARGGARICEAVNRAIDLIEERKDTYRANGVGYFRPWMFILTDGMTADSQDLPATARRVKDIEVAQGVTTFAIISGDARYDDAREQVRPLTDRTLHRTLHMGEASYDVLLEWMANSTVARSNSNASERSRMEDPTAGLKWKPKPNHRLVRRRRQGGGSQAHPVQPAQSGRPAVPDQDALCYRSRPGTDRLVVVVCDGTGVLQKVESAHTPPPRRPWKAVRK